MTMSTASFPRGHHRVGFRITKQSRNPGAYLATSENLYATDQCTLVGRHLAISDQAVSINTGGSFEWDLDLSF